MVEPCTNQRIDKWLWHARFVKTRTLAQKLVNSGGVRANRNKITSASYKIQPGMVLTLTLPGGIRIVEIVDLAARRGPFSQASQLYKDLTPPREKTEPGKEFPKHASVAKEKRPDREDRRAAIRMKRNFGD